MNHKGRDDHKHQYDADSPPAGVNVSLRKRQRLFDGADLSQVTITKRGSSDPTSISQNKTDASSQNLVGMPRRFW